jgi:hypothetical protein
MREWMTLGTVPYEEDCVQVNPNKDYLPAMQADVRRFVKFLEERFPNIPEEACFGVKRESGHDAGTYLEAAIYWNTDCTEAEQFAYFVESNIPARWDDFEQLDWKAKEAVPH